MSGEGVEFHPAVERGSGYATEIVAEPLPALGGALDRALWTAGAGGGVEGEAVVMLLANLAISSRVLIE